MPIVGHGIDIVEVSRIGRMLAEHGHQFLSRCFTPREQEVGRPNDDGSGGGRRYHEHLAARFAAKEAAMKALGTGLAHGISWTDCETINDPTGAPRLLLHNAALAQSHRLGATHWHISLTHIETVAMASVILESRGT